MKTSEENRKVLGILFGVLLIGAGMTNAYLSPTTMNTNIALVGWLVGFLVIAGVLACKRVRL